MTKCILNDNIKQKMNIVKFVKCYDYFTTEIECLVAKIEELEKNKAFLPAMKSRKLSKINAKYLTAVRCRTKSLDTFGKKIGLDISDKTQLDMFLEKYSDKILPTGQSDDIYHKLNTKFNVVLGNKMNSLVKENISEEGIVDRKIAVISSTVENVYGKEVEKLNGEFKLDTFTLKSKCDIAEKKVKAKSSCNCPSCKTALNSERKFKLSSRLNVINKEGK